MSRATQDYTKGNKIAVYGVITLYDQTFQLVPLILFTPNIVLLQPPYCRNNTGLGCSAFARHYLRNHFCFIFLRVLRCFSSPGMLRHTWRRCMASKPYGLPHSDIRGSKDMCSSPRLFAACHVLLRSLEPRHPPFALFLLFTFFFICVFLPRKISIPTTKKTLRFFPRQQDDLLFQNYACLVTLFVFVVSVCQ